jgi:DNA-binding response OmpR family regulator
MESFMMTNSVNGKISDSFSVLMVEDSPPQALKMKMALENGGCRVYWSETGFGGLGMAQQRRFDLIILDVELPDINGFEICRKLKADDDLKDIPVVMLTTLDSASDVMSGLDAGAIDYIPKDAFAELVLLETIKQMEGSKN